MNVNLELKVRCTPGDLLVIRDKALLLGAESFEILEQIDTYFRTGRGRLKLRSIRSDQVTGLGTFAELETVCEHTDELSAEEELRTVAIALGLDHLTIVAGSYADLGDA